MLTSEGSITSWMRTSAVMLFEPSLTPPRIAVCEWASINPGVTCLPEPSIVSVANVQHLGTRMEGMLSQPGPTVIELVRALSPTPALGGHPRAAAIELIERVEGFERGRYGCAVGWVDAAGNGTWAVAIRCAEISDDRLSARLVAGGGIVADSDPAAEYQENERDLSDKHCDFELLFSELRLNSVWYRWYVRTRTFTTSRGSDSLSQMTSSILL